MYKPDSVLENKTHKILFDFEIGTDHLIPTRRLDRVINKNKKENLKSWKLEDRLKSSKLQHCWDRLEYWEKFWKDLRRLAVIQTPVKNHPLTLVWKNLKE